MLRGTHLPNYFRNWVYATIPDGEKHDDKAQISQEKSLVYTTM